MLIHRRPQPSEVIVIADSSDDDEDLGSAVQSRVTHTASRRNKGSTTDKGTLDSSFLSNSIDHVSRPVTPLAGPSRVARQRVASKPRAGTSAQALTDTTNKEAPSTTMAMPAVAAAISPPIPMEVDPYPPPHSPDDYLALLLEIVPDVESQFAAELIANFVKQGLQNVVEHVVHHLLENATYPKAKNKGKRKRSESDNADDARTQDQPGKNVRVDYASKERPYKGGVHYRDMSLVCFPSRYFSRLSH
jgi:hypothetical protein